MIDKKTIIAVVLSIVVLLIYQYYFVPKLPHVSTPAASKQQGIEPTTLPKTTAAEIPKVEAASGVDIPVETGLYKAVLSTSGGTIKFWQLKKYKDEEGKPVILLKNADAIPPLGIILEGNNWNSLLNAVYSSDVQSLTLGGQKDKGVITFTYNNPSGLSIKKVFTFYNDDYRVDLNIEVSGINSYYIPLGTDFGVYDEKDTSSHKGPVLLVDSDRIAPKPEKINGAKAYTGYIKWIAQEDKYFTAALVPITKPESATIWKYAVSPEIALKVNNPNASFILYAGPKEYDRLKALHVGLENVIDFGTFSIIAMPLFWVLKFFYSFTRNYGVAIILLTAIVRIPFIPLINKGQRAMKKMQELQPKINELREKYKKDPQRMNKELMDIYKRNKVNPMGGCLPMLLQIPVFFALYNVLQKAIELRGAPFILWIKDLSLKDPYYVLPIVMGITMVIQQRMTPSSMDPTQSKMMMILPVVFTFMFLRFPSGLVLYWLVNNVLSIAQQYYINRSIKASS